MAVWVKIWSKKHMNTLQFASIMHTNLYDNHSFSKWGMPLIKATEVLLVLVHGVQVISEQPFEETELFQVVLHSGYLAHWYTSLSCRLTHELNSNQNAEVRINMVREIG